MDLELGQAKDSFVATPDAADLGNVEKISPGARFELLRVNKDILLPSLA